jgi:hypothetical protein
MAAVAQVLQVRAQVLGLPGQRVPRAAVPRVGDAVMSFGIKHFYEKATGWLYTYDVGPLPVSA